MDSNAVSQPCRASVCRVARSRPRAWPTPIRTGPRPLPRCRWAALSERSGHGLSMCVRTAQLRLAHASGPQTRRVRLGPSPARALGAVEQARLQAIEALQDFFVALAAGAFFGLDEEGGYAGSQQAEQADADQHQQYRYTAAGGGIGLNVAVATVVLVEAAHHRSPAKVCIEPSVPRSARYTSTAAPPTSTRLAEPITPNVCARNTVWASVQKRIRTATTRSSRSGRRNGTSTGNPSTQCSSRYRQRLGAR